MYMPTKSIYIYIHGVFRSSCSYRHVQGSHTSKPRLTLRAADWDSTGESEYSLSIELLNMQTVKYLSDEWGREKRGWRGHMRERKVGVGSTRVGVCRVVHSAGGPCKCNLNTNTKQTEVSHSALFANFCFVFLCTVFCFVLSLSFVLPLDQCIHLFLVQWFSNFFLSFSTWHEEILSYPTSTTQRQKSLGVTVFR